MCYSDLTCNVEILICLYIFILWKIKKNKDLLQFELSKMKNLQVPQDVFLVLWTLLGPGHGSYDIRA